MQKSRITIATSTSPEAGVASTRNIIAGMAARGLEQSIFPVPGCSSDAFDRTEIEFVCRSESVRIDRISVDASRYISEVDDLITVRGVLADARHATSADGICVNSEVGKRTGDPGYDLNLRLIRSR